MGPSVLLHSLFNNAKTVASQMHTALPYDLHMFPQENSEKGTEPQKHPPISPTTCTHVQKVDPSLYWWYASIHLSKKLPDDALECVPVCPKLEVLGPLTSPAVISLGATTLSFGACTPPPPPGGWASWGLRMASPRRLPEQKKGPIWVWLLFGADPHLVPYLVGVRPFFFGA